MHILKPKPIDTQEPPHPRVRTGQGAASIIPHLPQWIAQPAEGYHPHVHDSHADASSLEQHQPQDSQRPDC